MFSRLHCAYHPLGLAVPGPETDQHEHGLASAYIDGVYLDELATAIQHIIQSGLQRWLSELIEVRAVDVEAEGETMSVLVRFRTRDSEAERVMQVVRQA